MADPAGAPPVRSRLASGPLAGALAVFVGSIMQVAGLALPQAHRTDDLLGDSTIYPNSRATAIYIALAAIAVVFALVALSQGRPRLTALAGLPGLGGGLYLVWYVSDLATGRRDQRLCEQVRTFCGETTRPGSGAWLMLAGAALIVAGAVTAWLTSRRP